MKNDLTQLEIKDASRRRALFGAVSGATVVSAWQTPLVKSVVLPAHARTSDIDMDTPDVDFMATSAVASVTNTAMTETMLDLLVPIVNAQSEIINEPNFTSATDLIFVAEALSMGSSSYDITIAARYNPDSSERLAETNYIYGWSGTITGLNNATTLTRTGCADDELVTIISATTTKLVLEMDYFTENLTLELDPGTIVMPAFPLVCSVG